MKLIVSVLLIIYPSLFFGYHGKTAESQKVDGFLTIDFTMLKLVGATRFERATSSTPRKRSTKLSHAPTAKSYFTFF